MKINDRGTKKWTSLMLPEHVEALKKMWQEFDHVEKPVLDEQQIQENEFKLKGALQYKVEVRIEYFAGHDFKSMKGMIKNIRNKIIFINDRELNFDDIIDVEFVHSVFDL